MDLRGSTTGDISLVGAVPELSIFIVYYVLCKRQANTTDKSFCAIGLNISYTPFARFKMILLDIEVKSGGRLCWGFESHLEASYHYAI